MNETNRQLVQRMHEAFSKGDIATVKDCWAEDIMKTRVMVCTIYNGRIVRTRIYPGDQYALDEFWS